jgi:hypothetical protein
MSSTIPQLEFDASNSPQASRYDRFNAGLIASIIVFGFLVLSLAMVWLFGGERSFQFAPPLEEPGEVLVDEKGNVDEPEFDEVVRGFNTSDLPSALESIENAVSSVKTGGGLNGKGIYGVPGPRVPGPPIPTPIDSVGKRWKISMEVADFERYKTQLDNLGIEICVVHATEQGVWRLRNFSSGVEVTESDREAENALESAYFAHATPRLKKWDREIAKVTGMDLDEKILLQRYPEKLIARILELEAKKLEELGRNLSEVDQTNVKLELTGEHFSISVSGFEFR